MDISYKAQVRSMLGCLLFSCTVGENAATTLNDNVQVTVPTGRDSTIVIRFAQPLDVESITSRGLKLTRQHVDGKRSIEKDLEVTVSRVTAHQVYLETTASLAESGLLKITYQPGGNWKYADGTRVDALHTVVGARPGLVERWGHIDQRRWVGPNLWANRLQDWQVRNGRLECITATAHPPMRTVHAITREVSIQEGEEFHLAVQVKGPVNALREDQSLAGFLIGAGNGWLDYRAAAVVQAFSGLGGGLLCVVDYAANRLTFRNNHDEEHGHVYPELDGIEYIPGESSIDRCEGDMLLELTVRKESDDDYTLALTGWDVRRGTFLGTAVLQHRPASDIRGSLALVAHPGKAGFQAPLAFADFRCWGPMIRIRTDRQFGPVAGALYSLNGDVLRMAIQFMPLAWPGVLLDRHPAPLLARLEFRKRGSGTWQKADVARISQPEYMAFFRIEPWDGSQEYEYRVTFRDKWQKDHVYPGIIRRDPVDQEVVSFVALTGMGVMGRRADSDRLGEGAEAVEDQPPSGRWTPSNMWFPHSETVANIKAQDPDIIFFTGDQIYENNPTKPDRRDRFPVLDYLYKWYLWHWSFREVTRNRPVICQVDDHDVYAGNVWGYSGALNLTGYNYDTGGYMMDPLFVQLVERTQCLHNPDPYRFTEPMKNSIQTYFGSLTYGGISFAILEDRKFKSPPPLGSYTPTDEILLGTPQLRFLDEWASDKANAAVKVVISQTTYASTHTAWDDLGMKDYDSGGYPKEGRDRALKAFRKARAFIVAGDQHLGTVIRMGIEKPGDAALQFCVPAVGNIYWRWFFPEPLLTQWEQSGVVPDVSGDYRDGFGNHFRMIAVANPGSPDVMRLGRTRAWLPQDDDVIRKRVSKGDGYGRVVVDKAKRQITLECYPFDADLSHGQAAQFPGWPQTFGFDKL
ncbi:MAG: alkaline phosphatase D family protein [Fidelibacterota bacterium]|nr:MAG: alkaline phosphatase D family protein [Candidatus Neomarinimicrobiota bacterium]